MKNFLKLSLLSAGFVITTSAFAQDATKKQDTKKSTTTETKTAKDAGKTDSSKSGGTRMAITEQGTPKKRKTASAADTSTPAKKKE